MKQPILGFFLLAPWGCANSSAPVRDANQGTADASPSPDARPQVDASSLPDAPHDAASGGTDASPSPDAAPPKVTTQVWFAGDFVTNNVQQGGTFWDGTSLPVTPTTFPQNGTLPSSVGPRWFDVSEDGARIVYVSPNANTGSNELTVAASDGASPAVVYAAPVGQTISYPLFSPNGEQIAFLADPTVAGMEDLFVVAASGGTPRQVSPARTTAPSSALAVAGTFRWSPAGTHLAFVARITEANVDEAWLANVQPAVIAPVAVIPHSDIQPQTAGTRGVRGSPVFDNQGRLYLRARLQTDGLSKLYRAEMDGTGRTELALAPVRSDASPSDIGPIEISPAGDTLVFAADSPVATAFNLFAVSLAAPAAPTQLTSTTLLNSEPALGTPLWFAPSGQAIAFVADYQTDGDYEPYVALLSGGATRLFDISVQSTDADAMAWTADGSAVYVTGDFEANNDTRLYRLLSGAADQLATRVLGPLPSGGDISQLIVRHRAP